MRLCKMDRPKSDEQNQKVDFDYLTLWRGSGNLCEYEKGCAGVS